MSAAILQGPAGTATRVSSDLIPQPNTEVVTWFLHCPGQSPAWSHFVLGICSLADHPQLGHSPVTIPHATHVVLLAALDDDERPVDDDITTWRFLTPVNVHEEIQLPSDDDAVRLAELCAKAVVDGHLFAEPPLSGQVEPWRTTLLQTSAHYRGEAHGIGGVT